MGGRLNWIIAMFAIAIAAIVLRQVFATAWSNRCDPGNARFLLLKSDGVVTFRPEGELFTLENDGPDNSWLCSDASLSVSHVGPRLSQVFEATRQNMTQNGWTQQGDVPDQDFAVYEKVVQGVTLTAVVRKEVFWVEVDLNAPGFHLGEYGF